MSEYLKLTDILSVQDATYAEVETPEWGEGSKVRVKSMTSIDRDRYEGLMFQFRNDPKNTKSWEGMRARVVASCLCDEEGKRLFSSSDQGWRKLNEKSAAVIARIFEKCMEISGLGAEAEGKSEITLIETPG